MAIFERTLDSTNYGKMIHRVKVTVDTQKGMIRCQSWGFESNGQAYKQIELVGKNLSLAGMKDFARYADSVYFGRTFTDQSVSDALEYMRPHIIQLMS